MRTLVLLSFFFFTGFISFAHCIGPDHRMGIVGQGSALTLTMLPERPDLKMDDRGVGFKCPGPNNAVSIYVFKDTKVKRALKFKAKKDKPLWV